LGAKFYALVRLCGENRAVLTIFKVKVVAWYWEMAGRAKYKATDTLLFFLNLALAFLNAIPLTDLSLSAIIAVGVIWH